MEEWVHWDLHDLADDNHDEEAEETLKEIIERRNTLKEKLEKLNALIYEQEECWAPHHGFS